MERTDPWGAFGAGDDRRLGLMAATLIVGNLLDGLFTVTLLQLHLVREANPVMRWLYEGSPLSFMATKLLCVHVGLMLLWGQRHLPAAQRAMATGAAVYAAVVLYHLSLIAAASLPA